MAYPGRDRAESSRIGDTSTMPSLPNATLRWTALVGVWLLVGAVLWITLVQVFLLALNPFCHLQRPGVSRLEVVSVDRNAESQITDFVTARRGDETRVLTMSKAEASSLREFDDVWIMDAWYADGLRPTQYRLSPLRILLEYPLLLLLPAAWALWRLRKARQKAEAAPPPPIRRTFTDDFHLRAQRFARPEPAKDCANEDQDEKTGKD